MKARVCELCDGEAALYCPSDSAFLCRSCDATVHEANFLVARHVRCAVCSECKGLTDNRVSGAGVFQSLRRICRSCSHESPVDNLVDSLLSSSSSACISTAESSATPPPTKKKVHVDRLKTDKVVSSSSVTDFSSEHSNFPARFSGEVTSRSGKSREGKMKTLRSRPPPPNVDAKDEGVLVNWCMKLGFGGVRCWPGVVPVAIKGFGVCRNELAVLPFRASLAASLWFSLRFCGDRSASTWRVLKRLEEVSGVPAKVILASESKLARLISSRRRERSRPRNTSSSNDQPEEGWAESECSV